MSASKLEAGQLIIEAFKAALDTIDNFVGNDGPSYERAKRGLDVAEEFFRTEQPQPHEDPDEWVIQDRVPMRDVVDQGRYQLKETRPSHDAIWYALSDLNMKTRGLTHGATHPYDPNCMLFVRCRRRDLPKVEQAERWPKYWETDGTAENVAFIRQTSEERFYFVCFDGSEELQLVKGFRPDRTRKQLTEAEAMALLNKPQPQPQKTRVRLWMRNDPRGRPSLFACDERPYPDSHKYVEIHHDSEGFYVENQP